MVNQAIYWEIALSKIYRETGKFETPVTIGQLGVSGLLVWYSESSLQQIVSGTIFTTEFF